MTLELIEGESLWTDEDPLTEVTWTGQNGEVVRSVDLINYGYLFSHELPEQDWAVPYLVPSGGQVVIYSKAGHGKSLLMLEACAALATGRELFGEPGRDPVHVLYFDQEMTEEDLRDRLEAFGYGPEDAPQLQQFLHYVQLQNLDPLDTEQGGQMFMDIVNEFDPAVTVIDTMLRFIEGEENSADTYKAVDRYVSRRMKAEHRSLVRLDHAGKDASKGMRGSSAKEGYVDVSWRLVRDNGRQWEPVKVTLTCDKSRVSTIRLDQKLIFHVENDPLRHVYVADREIITPEIEDIIRLLEDAGVDADESVRRACAAIHKRQDPVRIAQKERKRRLQQPN